MNTMHTHMCTIRCDLWIRWESLYTIPTIFSILMLPHSRNKFIRCKFKILSDGYTYEMFSIFIMAQNLKKRIWMFKACPFSDIYSNVMKNLVCSSISDSLRLAIFRIRILWIGWRVETQTFRVEKSGGRNATFAACFGCWKRCKSPLLAFGESFLRIHITVGTNIVWTWTEWANKFWNWIDCKHKYFTTTQMTI